LDYALAALERHGPVAAWVVDDTGIPKKGDHSVGVARQYCGALGKQDNCQVAVTVSLANRALSIPATYRLYLPEEWAAATARRKAAGVPSDVAFQTKWQIALGELHHLIEQQVPRAPVLADAGYGDATAFREGIAELGLSYAVMVKGGTTVWPPGSAPLGPRRWSGRGRPPKRLRRDATHRPVSLEALATTLPKTAWKTVDWRTGTKGPMRSRFARVRVIPAHRDHLRVEPRAEEWLLIEWPREAAQPTKYWLSNAPPTAPFEDLVQLVTLRWWIERDYEELKSEFGLDHYEGRGWRGFHHHGVLAIAAYAFLVAERARLSPPQPLAFLQAASLPRGFRPRGAPPAPGAA
jgi:SRSO17 transposase